MVDCMCKCVCVCVCVEYTDSAIVIIHVFVPHKFNSKLSFVVCPKFFVHKTKEFSLSLSLLYFYHCLWLFVSVSLYHLIFVFFCNSLFLSLIYIILFFLSHFSLSFAFSCPLLSFLYSFFLCLPPPPRTSLFLFSFGILFFSFSLLFSLSFSILSASLFNLVYKFISNNKRTILFIYSTLINK